MPTTNVEHYLAAIYVLSVETHDAFTGRVAEYMGISAPSVTQALRRLRRDGLVLDDGARAITLTPEGLLAAEQVVRRHRLAERWIYDVLGLGWAECHREAHRLEHALTPLIEERLWESLHRPATCPHGNPIPGLATPDAAPLPTLADLPTGLHAVVDRIFEQLEGRADVLRSLHRQGLVPGAEVAVVAAAPKVLTLLAGEVSLELPRATAQRLLVRTVKSA